MSYSIKTQAGVSVFTSIGTVNSEESNKDAQLFQMPIPLSDSTSTVMLDLFGASRTITIKGKKFNFWDVLISDVALVFYI